MTTTENSRADALTEAVTRTIETIKRQLDLIADRAPGNFLDKRNVVQSLGAHVRRLEKALAEAESLQPAAAPIDANGLGDLIFDLARMDSRSDRVKAANEIIEKIAPAPSPADERAAFDSEVGNIIADAATRGIAWMAFKVGARYARAASANDTGAEEAAEPYDEGDIERHFDDHGFYLHGFEEEDRANFFEAALALVAGRSPAMAAEAVASPATAILLAEPHTGMRVDYSGLLRQARRALKLGMQDTGSAEMLRQLHNHLTELGQRWYAGDTAVVDELLQLYCVEKDARDALAAAPQPAQADAREEAYVAKRMAETLATVYATIVGDDQVDENDGLNAIQRCERAAQVLRLEVELYRGQADARVGLTDEQREAIDFVIGWYEQCTIADNPYREHIAALRALLQGANHD